MEDLSDNEVKEITSLKKRICSNLSDLIESINSGKKRHNKAILTNKILKEIQATREFKRAFKPFLEAKSKSDKLKSFKAIEEFIESEIAADVFNDEENIEYFIKNIYPDIINFNMLSDFKELKILIDLRYLNNYTVDEYGDIWVSISFNNKFLKINFDYNLISEYFDEYLKEISIRYLRSERIQENIARKVEEEFQRRLSAIEITA